MVCHVLEMCQRPSHLVDFLIHKKSTVMQQCHQKVSSVFCRIWLLTVLSSLLGHRSRVRRLWTTWANRDKMHIYHSLIWHPRCAQMCFFGWSIKATLLNVPACCHKWFTDSRDHDWVGQVRVSFTMKIKPSITRHLHDVIFN